MTDKEKLEAIKAEIERLYEIYVMTAHTPFKNGKCEALRQVLDLMNSFPEEPVSEDLEEALKCKVRAIFDSLEKFDVNDKEKNRVAFGLIELEAYAKMFYNIGKQAGAQWQKEQMMKDAIDTVMIYDDLNDLVPGIEDLSINGYTVGDKVKVIIIKEE